MHDVSSFSYTIYSNLTTSLPVTPSRVSSLSTRHDPISVLSYLQHFVSTKTLAINGGYLSNNANRSSCCAYMINSGPHLFCLEIVGHLMQDSEAIFREPKYGNMASI